LIILYFDDLISNSDSDFETARREEADAVNIWD
jgi:hypothetical protein